jgi:hypothetical protein
MRKQRRLSGVIWGLLTIIVAALMLEAGVREVIAYWGREVIPVVVGVLGASASSVLLVSGFALLTRRPSGRSTATAGAAGMIAVHLVGWILGIVGHGGALPGVVYPMLLLAVLKARPNLSAPMSAGGSTTQSETPSSSGQSHRKAMTRSLLGAARRLPISSS